MNSTRHHVPVCGYDRAQFDQFEFRIDGVGPIAPGALVTGQMVFDENVGGRTIHDILGLVVAVYDDRVYVWWG